VRALERAGVERVAALVLETLAQVEERQVARARDAQAQQFGIQRRCPVLLPDLLDLDPIRQESGALDLEQHPVAVAVFGALHLRYRLQAAIFLELVQRDLAEFDMGLGAGTAQTSAARIDEDLAFSGPDAGAARECKVVALCRDHQGLRTL